MSAILTVPQVRTYPSGSTMGTSRLWTADGSKFMSAILTSTSVPYVSVRIPMKRNRIGSCDLGQHYSDCTSGPDVSVWIRNGYKPAVDSSRLWVHVSYSDIRLGSGCIRPDPYKRNYTGSCDFGQHYSDCTSGPDVFVRTRNGYKPDVDRSRL